jgi:hypothetical protein
MSSTKSFSFQMRPERRFIQLFTENKDQFEAGFQCPRAELMLDIVVKCDETRYPFLCMSTATNDNGSKVPYDWKWRYIHMVEIRLCCRERKGKKGKKRSPVKDLYRKQSRHRQRLIHNMSSKSDPRDSACQAAEFGISFLRQTSATF